jgi:hypothetical protein
MCHYASWVAKVCGTLRPYSTKERGYVLSYALSDNLVPVNVRSKVGVRRTNAVRYVLYSVSDLATHVGGGGTVAEYQSSW